MRAAAFENVVQGLYKYVVPKPKADCSKPEQLGVSFLAGYIAGADLQLTNPPVFHASLRCASASALLFRLELLGFAALQANWGENPAWMVFLPCSPHAIVSGAGVFCAVVSHPADNLVSKLNSTKGVSVGQIIQEMGWVALLTRGLGLRILMVGTLTGMQWGIYDAFKVAVGLPTTGAGACGWYSSLQGQRWF